MSRTKLAGRRNGTARDRALERLASSEPGRCALAHERSIPYGPSLRVESYHLDNGLRLLTLVDRSAPVVSYHTWFRVGARHERDGKSGLAHLLEHLMFGALEDLPAGAFDRQMEEAGAETNAATWVDWTYYYANVPSSQLARVIDLESRRMGKLHLHPDAFRSEIDVVTNERKYRVEDDIGGAVSERLYELAFARHAYGRPTIGRQQDIEALTLDDCAWFYRTYYAPNNATIVIAGSFDEIKTLSLVARAYAYLARAEIPVEDSHPEPFQGEERRDILRKPTATHKIALGYHAPALGDVDHAPLALLCDVLFGGRASRVHQAMVRDAELATDVRGWVGPFREPGLLEIHAAARQGRTSPELLEALDEQLARVIAAPVEEHEVERAKARAELGLVRSMETSAGRAEQLAFYDTVLGDPVGALARLELLRRATRSDVLRVARRYLLPASRTVVAVHPLDEGAKE
jgi:zinc protease